MGATVRICGLHNEGESLLVCRLLEQEGIPFVLRRTEDAAYDGIFTLQNEWAYIEAPEEQAGKIRAIVDGVRQGRLRTGPGRSAVQ